MKHENIIFDLDGTLCDSEESILSTLEATLAEMGDPVLPREVLRRFISPPLIDSFIRYCGFTEEQAAKGLKIYQRIYAEGGWDKHVLFDGIEDILKALQSRGAQLFVATSKEEGAAEHVLESMGIKGYFRAVSGANKDNSISKKKDILLSLFARENLKAEDCVLVGDSPFDVRGAAEAGINCIAVSYGFATKEELAEAGAKVLLNSVAELKTYLLETAEKES